MDNNLAIVVLAAGQGTRMKSATPKILHPLAGAPIIAHVLATARALDAAHVVAVVRHERDLVAQAIEAELPGTVIVDQDEIPGTGRAVEQACWMCGVPADFEEHREAGFEPRDVLERYYFYGRPGQPFNRVVDVSAHIEKKIEAIAECKSQGGGNFGSQLRARLAKEGKRLPLLGDDDHTADRAYVRQFLVDRYSEFGKPYGLQYAERFYYIDQRRRQVTKVDEYVAKNAVSI